MQGYNRQYSGSGRQTFGGGGGYGGGYDSRGTLMGSAGGPMRGPGGGYPDNWGSGMGSSYGSSNYNRSMGAGYGSNRQQGQSTDLRDSLNHMRDMGGRENTLALGILDAVKSLGVLGGYGPSGSRQGPSSNAQSNRTLVQLTHPGGQMPPGSNQPPFNRGAQQNWNRNTGKVNMVKRLGSNQFNKAKLQQTKKPVNKITLIKTAASKVEKKVSPKKEGETEDEDNEETETATTGENGTAEVTESSEKKNDDTPKEALKCHMCDVDNFASVTAYLNHLESQNHQQMSELFHAKGRVTLQLLQSNAALATQRIMNNSRKVGVKGRILECFKCQCRIPSTLAKHMKSPEHQLVVNFMAEKCCGRSYNNREDLEEHRLSLVHLRRQMACEARKDEKADKDQEQIEALGMEGLTTEEQQAALNNKVEEDVKAVHVDIAQHYTLETIPPYDPDRALGKNLVLTKTQYQCRCCRQLFPSGLNAIESHCRSSNHYEHFLAHVKQQAEQKQGKIEKKDGANSDSDDSKAESEVKKEKTPEAEENNKEEEEEPELDMDLDAMETIDIPLDGTKFDDDEEEVDEDKMDEEKVGEEKKVEDELWVNDVELEEENGAAEKKDEEESTEDKTATSEKQDTVNEEAEIDDDDDDDMGVNSPASLCEDEDEDDDDDDDDEDDDEEDFNPKRRARGSTKSTPAKRSLTAAPARRGRHPSSL